MYDFNWFFSTHFLFLKNKLQMLEIIFKKKKAFYFNHFFCELTWIQIQNKYKLY